MFEEVQTTYNHFFEMQPIQPEGEITPIAFTPSRKSFKLLAETPLQSERSESSRQNCFDTRVCVFRLLSKCGTCSHVPI